MHRSLIAGAIIALAAAFLLLSMTGCSHRTANDVMYSADWCNGGEYCFVGKRPS